MKLGPSPSTTSELAASLIQFTLYIAPRSSTSHQQEHSTCRALLRATGKLGESPLNYIILTKPQGAGQGGNSLHWQS